MNPSARATLDGDCTTVAWQTATTRVAVLPIGSFEQHGGRLPLRTDSLLAEHFAGLLAQDLGAALLPVIAYATSLENSGYRGTISLRPETAMALLRDIVASLEVQGFHRLIVVNGHGGNFFLGPVLREINAQDRAIKVITVDCGGPFENSPEGRCLHDGELHAGASEISRILAIRPDLVRPPSEALPLAGAHDPHFLRSDLNTFGIGARDPSGVWGDPEGGDAAIGRAMNGSIAANQVRHVRERLAWLQAQPGYCGTGGIALRPLVDGDIDDGLRLCRAAGWNQQRADWRLLLELRPDGCRAAVHLGAVVGTVTTLLHDGRCAWIGMVLVDPQRRRLGIGTRLLAAALELLGGCPAIGLDATMAGKAVYDRLGFADHFALVRMVRRPGRPPTNGAPSGVRPMTERDLPAVTELDAQAFGASRGSLVRWLYDHGRDRAWVATGTAGSVTGFAMGRAGEAFDQIGPVVADSSDDAIALVLAALAAQDDRPAGIDIPLHPAWQSWLERQGFVEERRFMRMFRGVPPAPAGGDRLFAIAGPELG